MISSEEKRIKIIKEADNSKPFLVIWKPRGLPSAPLSADDKENALSQAISLFPQIKNVCGKKEIEYGLLHRLDTATEGLMVIAVNQDCYNFLSEEQAAGRFVKYYTAHCDIISDNANLLGAFPKEPKINKFLKNQEKTLILESYFRFFGQGRKEVRPVTQNDGKAALSKVGHKKFYRTTITILEKNSEKAKVECKITEGFRHQVRCHLAWAGLPVEGDYLYNSRTKKLLNKSDTKLLFSATKLSFNYPVNIKNVYEYTPESK